MITTPHVDAATRTVLDHDPAGLILDLSAVRLLTCHGLTLVDEIDREVAGHLDFAVVKGAATTRPLLFAGLHQRLALYSQLHAAIWALTGMTPSAVATCGL